MPNNNALHIAAQDGDLEQVQSQVSNFDINAKGEDGGTALYWSARNGHAEIVKLLLTFNPDVNIPDVSTIQLIAVHFICCISHIPLSLFYAQLSIPLGVYCCHSYPITRYRYYLLQLVISNVTSCHRFIKSSLLCPITPTCVIFRTVLPYFSIT